MDKQAILLKLGTLTARERQVLKLVCGGRDYQSIADELVIAIGTVKATMGHIYIKLGLEDLGRAAKRKELFQIYCQALEGEEAVLPPPPPEPMSLLPVPVRVERMVNEDEYAVVPVRAQIVEMRPPRTIRRGIPIWLRWVILGLFIIVMVAVGVVGGRYVSDWLQIGSVPTPAVVPTQQAVVATSAPQVAIVVTSTPEATVATPVPATERPLPTNTHRPAPTNTSRPQPTDTPVGMMDMMVQVSGEETDMEDAVRGPASSSSWIESGIYVQSGDRLTITYVSGEWWIGYLQGDTWYPQIPTDAGGYTGREEDRVVAAMGANDPSVCYELRSAPIASLIGRIERDGPVFFIGNTYDEIVTQTGNLYLRMNYNSPVGFAYHTAGQCPTANGGSVTVRVQVTPP